MGNALHKPGKPLLSIKWFHFFFWIAYLSKNVYGPGTLAKDRPPEMKHCGSGGGSSGELGSSESCYREREMSIKCQSNVSGMYGHHASWYGHHLSVNAAYVVYRMYKLLHDAMIQVNTQVKTCKHLKQQYICQEDHLKTKVGHALDHL